MRQKKVQQFTNLDIATGLGVTVLQVMDFFTNESKISKNDLRIIWAPFLAGTTRIANENADNMVRHFNETPKNSEVKDAVVSEWMQPNPLFYKKFEPSLKESVNIVAKGIGEFAYLIGINNANNIDKTNIANELIEMFKYYLKEQSSRNSCSTDSVFINVISMAIAQNVEDVCTQSQQNGLTNTGKMIEVGQVSFATSFVLYAAT